MPVSSRSVMDPHGALTARRPRPVLRNGKRDWYRVQNAASDTPDTTTVWIYDEISYCGVTAEAFCKDLAEIDTPNIDVRINSPGGDLFDGVAIYNSLVAHPATIHTHVDGLAASAASLIAMAGDEITMGAGTQLMIHDGMAVCVGNTTDMLESAALLDKVSNEIAGFYARRGGGTAADWRAVMKAEAWYSGEEAVAVGLADSVTAPVREKPTEVPSNEWDLSVFAYAGRANAPDPRMPTFRELVDASPMNTAYLSLFRNSARKVPV